MQPSCFSTAPERPVVRGRPRHPRRLGAATSLAAAAGLVALFGPSPLSGATATLGVTGAGAAAIPVAAAALGFAATTSPGCAARPAAGSGTLHVTFQGVRRLVIVHAPRAQGDGPLPLVLNLHGSDSDARQQELLSAMDATADRDGFLVAYPQAALPEPSGFGWNVPGEPLTTDVAPPKGAPNDVAFLTALPSLLGRRYCLDLRKVYATGISGGARMVSQLACDAPTTFAAVAPVAGLRFPAPCPARRAVPVLAFHGTADPIDPYGGHGLPYWTSSVPVAAARWAAHDRCRPARRTAGAGYRLATYAGCAGGSTVALYTLLGEGHEWPGGPRLPAVYRKLLGPQTDAVHADAAMWRFFSSYELPAPGVPG